MRVNVVNAARCGSVRVNVDNAGFKAGCGPRESLSAITRFTVGC